MKTGITINKVSYYCNESKGTVVCVMNCVFAGYNYQVKGVAKKSPEDTYNEVIGKRVAESKAKAAIYKMAANFYRDRYKTLAIRADKSFKLAQFCYNLSNKEKLHIEEIVK